MAYATVNGVRLTPTLGGTTDWTYSAAVTGFNSPALAGMVSGRTYVFRAESADFSQWELAAGAWNGTALIRTTVLQNSAGTGTLAGQSGAGTKINFTLPPTVTVTMTREDLVSAAEAITFTANEKAQGRANIDVLKKNYTINGAMMVSQENGTTAGTTSAYYATDQFNVSFSHGGTVSIAQVASATPGGSPNRLRVTVTAADAAVAAGDFMGVFQSIEGLRVADLLMGTASARTIVVQFGVKAPAGTYCVVIKNGALNRSYVAEYVISGPEANTDVVKSVSFLLDTTGTWLKDTGIGCYLSWGLMCGSTFQQAAGSWAAGNFIGSSNQFNLMGTNGNVFELFDVGMHEGAAAPAFQVPDFASEIQLCQRYWEKSYDYVNAPGSTSAGLTGTEGFFVGPGFASSTIQLGWSMRFKVRKRAAPTITTYSYNTGASGKITDAVAAADINSTVDSVSEVGARVYSTATGAATSVSRYYQWTANARL